MWAGIVSIVCSVAFLWAVLPGLVGLMMVLFLLGAIGMVAAGTMAVPGLLSSEEDPLNRAYLGLGLAIGSVILLGVGTVLAWL
jgi:hypothetical protein